MGLLNLSIMDCRFDHLGQVLQWALVGARMDGQVIEGHNGSGDWEVIDNPLWCGHMHYRLRDNRAEFRIADARAEANLEAISKIRVSGY